MQLRPIDRNSNSQTLRTATIENNNTIMQAFALMEQKIRSLETQITQLQLQK
jgi:hypothetical protein